MPREIGFENGGAPEHVADYVRDVTFALYHHLPGEYRGKMVDEVDSIILDTPPGYLSDDVGAYKDGDVYIADRVTGQQDPKRIAEVAAHEFGHPLLDDVFPGMEKRTADLPADFLVFHAVREPEEFDRAADHYAEHREAVTAELGDPEPLRQDIDDLVAAAKEDWYPELERDYRDLVREHDPTSAVTGWFPDEVVERVEADRGEDGG